MRKLRQKSLLASLPKIILFLILGSIFFIPMVTSVALLAKGPLNLESIDFSEDIEGVYVTGTVYGIYGAYCEETRNARVTSVEYIIDAGPENYMGMNIPSKDIKKADALFYASYDYQEGLDDGSALEAAQFQVTGTIKKMPHDSLLLYHEYLEWDSMNLETKNMFLPYYLCVDDIGFVNLPMSIIATILALVLISMALYEIVKCISGRYQKHVTDYIAKCSDSVAIKEKIEHFISNTPGKYGVLCSEDFICGQDKAMTTFGDSLEVTWIYENITRQYINSIPTIRTYSITLGFSDGTRQNLSVKKEKHLKELLDYISSFCPQAVVRSREI